MKKKIGNIKWRAKDVPIVDILPTPKNYKIKNDLGLQRLQTSLADFGIAGAVIVNPAPKGKWVLIDGNSRLQELKDAKQKTVSISYPNRVLSPKEFVNMCKLFDLAKAGDVDIKEIEAEGTTADYFKKFGLEVPMHLLSNMGAKRNVKELEFPGSKKEGKQVKMEVNDIMQVNLFFTTKQEEEFRKLADKLGKKYKTDNVTLIVLKVMRAAK